MAAASAGSVRVLADRSASPVPRPFPAPIGVWADLAPRLGSALILVPLALLCAWSGGLAWAAILAAGLALLVREFSQIARAGHLSAAPTLAGLAYLGLACVSLIWLRAEPLFGREAILFLFCSVWSTDIGAYLVGRWLGGPRMAPAISPGKTWSGAVAGVLAAGLAGACFGRSLRHALLAAFFAALLSVAAQAGDLLESALKRRCGVKDAGRLIPGHGGLLDRVDSLLCAALLMAGLGLWLGRGWVFWI